ncbi:hypothetical protein BGZ49_005828 [Haplosporangium sp. Z 27]|nr:hypothetical protein BGZ49_005828 [Haplosporangium sp. Z 27]
MSRPQFGVQYDSTDPVLRSIAREFDNIYNSRDESSSIDIVPSPANDGLPQVTPPTEQQQQKKKQQKAIYDFQLESFYTRGKPDTSLFPPRVHKQRYQTITVRERLILVSIGPSTANSDTSKQETEESRKDAVLVAGLEVLEYYLLPITKGSTSTSSEGSSDKTTISDRGSIERIIYIAKVDTSGNWPLPGIDSRGLKSPTHALVKGYLNGIRSINFIESPISRKVIGATADQLSSLTISLDEAEDVDAIEEKDPTRGLESGGFNIKKTSLYIFARAQPQYLFADSAKNSGKHVLDDRGLVRWWKNMVASVYSDPLDPSSDQKTNIQGWWHIPGIDTERGATRAIQSSSSSSSSEPAFNWTYGYPDKGSKEMANAVIPQFPDDPKSRLMRSPSGSDGYISVSTFWELTAIAEESGAGKITGFFRITEEVGETEKEESDKAHDSSSPNPSSKSESRTATYEPSRKNLKGTTKDYTKAINFLLDLNFSTLELSRESTRQWRKEVSKWTAMSRNGESEQENTDWRKTSWIQQLTVPIGLPQAEKITSQVTETNSTTVQSNPSTPTVLTLNSGLIRRKEPTPATTAINVLNTNLIKRKAPQTTGEDKVITPLTAPPVNVLSPGLIKRKVPQTTESPAATTQTMSTTEGPAVNILGSDLIKKRKVDS